MRTYINLEEGLQTTEEIQGRTWVNVECVDDDDRIFLVDKLGIPSEFLDDIADVDERPRHDNENSWQLIILRIPLDGDTVGQPYTTVPIGIMSNGEMLVSVCYRKTQLLPDFIKHIRRKNIALQTDTDFTVRMIYSSAVWFLKYLKLIYLEINRIEKDLEESVRNEALLRIMNLQKSLVYFNTSIRGNEAMLGRLRSAARKAGMDDDLLEDIQVELRQAHSTTNIYIDICNSTMNAIDSLISNNVNTIMKRMTSLSIILTIPTMIASFYGMNVDVHMSLIEPYAFFGIIAISIFLSIIALVLFRKIKWF